MADDKRTSVSSSARRGKSVAEEPVTSVLSRNEVPIFDRELTADEEVLAALGYKYALPKHCLDLPLTHEQVRIQARILAMDNFLCLLRSPGLVAVIRLDAVVRYGLFWHTGHGLGLADCHVLYSMRGHGHGYGIALSRLQWLANVSQLNCAPRCRLLEDSTMLLPFLRLQGGGH